MLHLSRRQGQAVLIDHNIKVHVVRIQGKNVKLAFEVPIDMKVLRQELVDKVQAENKAASESTQLFEEAFTND